MKRFILCLVLFAIPILLLLAWVEGELRSIPNNYSHKEILWTDPNTKVLVLGNSHGFYGVDPAYFTQRGFNAANVSQSIDLDLALFAQHETHMGQLTHVLIPISYNTLHKNNLRAGKEKWRLKNYVIYHDLALSYSPKDHMEILNGTMRNGVTRLMKFQGLGRTDLTCTPLGAGLHEPKDTSNDLVPSGKAAAERHTNPEGEHLQQNIADLKAILALARSHNARILLFTAPAHSSYREQMVPRQWDAAQRVIEELLVDPDIQYFDLIASPDFTASDFHDADHLNTRGARKLSLKLDSLMTFAWGEKSN